MSRPIITASGIGKCYQLNSNSVRPRYNSLRDSLAGAVKRGLKFGSNAKSKEKRDYWALKDVSFNLDEGQILGIIGRNGAGKSTLLKVLSRITDPTEGEITIRGRIASLLEVGTGFHPELTGRENIFLNGAILGMRRAEIKKQFDEIVDFAEVEEFLDTPVKHYSSGMYVRLAFAVAAHLEPEVLIIDEVLAVGDVAFQKKCMGRMKDVATSGRTIIFVSHSMNAVELLCTSAILMDKGKVVVHSNNVRNVINAYLVKNQEVGIDGAVWIRRDARYDSDFFTPTRFGLYSEDRIAVSSDVSKSQSVWIELEATILNPDPALTIGYDIFGEDGAHLYRSYQTDVNPDGWPIMGSGQITIRSKLPNFLNEGRYHVQLVGGLHHRTWLYEPGKETPGFTFGLSGGLSESPYWVVKRSGHIAPAIQWTKI